MIDPNTMSRSQLLELAQQFIGERSKGYQGTKLGDVLNKFFVVEKKDRLCLFRITHKRFGVTDDFKHKCYILGYEEFCFEGERPTVYSNIGGQTGSGEFWYHPYGRNEIKPLSDKFDKLDDGMIPISKMKNTHDHTPPEDHHKYFGDKSVCPLCRK